MLKLRDISYQPQTSDNIVIRNLNLEVSKNDIVLICGKSGSGKTTLIEIISGLISPQFGKIYWDQKVLNERKRRWMCGVVFQFPERFFIGSTIGKELKIGHKSLRETNLENTLRNVGLSEVDLTRPPENLSGGQQRRLAVAVQLLRNPKLLLLDEPTVGLDWSMRNDVKDLIKNLRNKNTVIIVTHEPELFKNLPTKIFQLKDGQLNLLKNKHL
tara:strand:- start:297 stop:938 length:642 start_codon:yes stop_codon:yes gene_type:complete